MRKSSISHVALLFHLFCCCLLFVRCYDGRFYCSCVNESQLNQAKHYCIKKNVFSELALKFHVKVKRDCEQMFKSVDLIFVLGKVTSN